MAGWNRYWRILRRRWWIIAAIVIADVLVAGVLYARSARSAGFQSCTTLYVADVSSPSIVAAPPTTPLGQLIAGETAANFFGDDILDVAQSRSVASFVSRSLGPQRLPGTSFSSVNGSISGSRLDRTVSLCVTNANSASAQAAASALGKAMTVDRKLFIGKDMARRTYVAVVSSPDVGPAPVQRSLLNLALRIALGVLLALGAALLWDAIDPQVRDREDVERALGAPVLTAKA